MSPIALNFSRNTQRHKVGNVGIFVLLEFENRLDATISHMDIISKHDDK